VTPFRVVGEHHGMPTTPPRPPLAQRRSAARALAEQYGGVVSRRLLRGVGVDRGMVAREVAAGRWQLLGRQTVAVHTGPVGDLARRWRAVWEVGHRIAVVDGVTALLHAGMTGFDDPLVHLSVRHTAAVRDVEGVRTHKVVRRVTDELVIAGLPRTRPAVAATRAAHWACSDRQAALLLCLPVQQRLCTGVQLAAAQQAIRGRTRRRLVGQLVRDVADGAQSLGELDVVAACRQRGLPEPSRQVVRRLPGGTAYLDIAWEEARLVVEVDGAGHGWALQPAHDALRQNEILLSDELVLRIDLIGWRLTPEAYADQIVRAYWQRVRRRAA
jgi:very-short-patch-repair endonuclease